MIGKSVAKFLDSSFAIFFLKLCGAGSSFLVSVVFLNLSTSEVLGKYALALTVISILAVLVVFGQNVAIMRHLTRPNNEGSAEYIRSAVVLSLSVFLVLSPIVCFILYVVFPQGVLFFYLLFAYYSATQLRSSILLHSKKHLLNSFYNDFMRTFWGLLYILTALLIAFKYQHGVDAFAVASVLVSIPLSISIFNLLKVFDFGLRDLVKGFGSRELAVIKRMYMTAVPVVVVAVLGILISQFDRVYVSLLLGYGVAGMYYAAQTLVSVINYFNQALISRKITAMVGAYQRNDVEALERLARNNSWVSFFFSLVALVGFVVLYPIVDVVFGRPGDEFFLVSMVLLSLQAFSLLFGFGSTVMLYSGSDGQKLLVKYLSISLVVAVAVGSGLVLVIGMVGAAVGTGVGILLNRLLPYLYFKKLGYNLGVFGKIK